MANCHSCCDEGPCDVCGGDAAEVYTNEQITKLKSDLDQSSTQCRQLKGDLAARNLVLNEYEDTATDYVNRILNLESDLAAMTKDRESWLNQAIADEKALAAEREKHAWRNVGLDGLPPDASLLLMKVQGYGVNQGKLVDCVAHYTDDELLKIMELDATVVETGIDDNDWYRVIDFGDCPASEESDHA